jgi:sorbitol-specific phosphotransferase system component IIBC
MIEVQIHREQGAITISVDTDTPQTAAELLSPFLREDAYVSGVDTEHRQVAQAILRDRMWKAQAAADEARQVEQQAAADMMEFIRVNGG